MIRSKSSSSLVSSSGYRTNSSHDEAPSQNEEFANTIMIVLVDENVVKSVVLSEKQFMLKNWLHLLVLQRLVV